MMISNENNMSIQHHIAQSIATNSIVHLSGDESVHLDLLAECDDSVENGTVTEYWGTTDEGYEWRVHVSAAPGPSPENAGAAAMRDAQAARTEDKWWEWHDRDASRWSSFRWAEKRCAAWVRGESDDGPEE